MSRYGARNGSPAARFGMKGRNDGAIRLARLGAAQLGHVLGRGIVTRDNMGVEVYSAQCRCGRMVVVRDDEGRANGTAWKENCDAT